MEFTSPFCGRFLSTAGWPVPFPVFSSSFLSMSGFYRADVFPVTPPTVLKRWRKSEVLTKTGGLASVFFRLSLDSR